MSLSVPPVTMSLTQTWQPQYAHQLQPVTPVPVTQPGIKLIDVKFDFNLHEIIFEDGQSCPVYQGNWIVVTTVGRFGAAGEPILPTISY